MIQLIRDSSEQGRVINHKDLASSRKKGLAGINGIGAGLVVAALGLVGALVYASTII